MRVSTKKIGNNVSFLFILTFRVHLLYLEMYTYDLMMITAYQHWRTAAVCVGLGALYAVYYLRYVVKVFLDPQSQTSLPQASAWELFHLFKDTR